MSLVEPMSTWWFALLGLVMSALAAAGWRRFALARALLDHPDPRRLHQVPTPRGGGIGIAMVLVLAALATGQGGGLVALGLVLAAGAGLLDDLRPLPVLAKLALQCLGAACLAFAWPLWPAVIGALPGFLAAFLLVLVLVNFWNFMDGSNGLAASQGLLFGAALLVLAGAGSAAGWLGLALAASALGFLPFNLPRARLFLGDVGSHALGYGVAASALVALAQGSAEAWQLLLLASAFLVDAGLTLLRRLLRGQRFWRAHREHVYQRAVAHGHSHLRVCLAYAGWTAAASALALALASASPAGQWVATATVLATGMMIHFLGVRSWPLDPSEPAMESAA